MHLKINRPRNTFTIAILNHDKKRFLYGLIFFIRFSQRVVHHKKDLFLVSFWIYAVGVTGMIDYVMGILLWNWEK